MIYGSFGFYKPKEESFSNQLDRNGMQLYSKEYKNWEETSPFHVHKSIRSDNQCVEYLDGVHFGDTP